MFFGLYTLYLRDTSHSHHITIRMETLTNKTVDKLTLDATEKSPDPVVEVEELPFVVPVLDLKEVVEEPFGEVVVLVDKRFPAVVVP